MYSKEIEFVKSKASIFADFMGIKTIPEFRVQIKPIKDLGSIFNIGTHTFSKAGHSISFPERIHELGDDIVPMIFHEFTHMIDFETLMRDRGSQFDIISLYSEFHATQVEIKKTLGWKSEHENRLFTSKDEYKFWDGKRSFLQELMRSDNDFRNQALKLCNNVNEENFDRSLTYLMYLVARVNIYNRFSSDKSSTIDAPKEVGRIFGKNGSNLWNMLTDTSAESVNILLTALAELRIKLAYKLLGSTCPKCKSTELRLIARRCLFANLAVSTKMDRVCVNCKTKF